jgi:hypothetical protein
MNRFVKPTFRRPVFQKAVFAPITFFGGESGGGGTTPPTPETPTADYIFQISPFISSSAFFGNGGEIFTPSFVF